MRRQPALPSTSSRPEGEEERALDPEGPLSLFPREADVELAGVPGAHAATSRRNLGGGAGAALNRE
jgi:hypothetical protein